MDALRTRSGRIFSPRRLWNLTKAAVKSSCKKHSPPINTSVDINSLVHAACELEDRLFSDGINDVEGMELSSRPPSPLTDLDSDNEDTEESLDKEHEDEIKPECQYPPQNTSESISKKRNRDSAKARRSRKRVKKATEGHPAHNYNPKCSIQVDEKETIKLSIDVKALPSSSGGAWVGMRRKGEKVTPWTLQELLEARFRLIEWDGENTRFIIDAQERIIAVLVGHPNDPNWHMVVNDASAVMTEVQKVGMKSDVLTDKYVSHRRGDFVALPVGVSFGGGGKQPGNLVHTKGQQRLVNRLLKSHSIRRIAGFQSSAFASFAPKLYKYYTDTLGKLFDHHDGLVHNFGNSVFPAASFNCGPVTVSLDHTDYGNLSHGLCALTALGSYDFTKGGHIIFFDLKLAIQFPPGSTCLITSGCLAHGNTPIQNGETRLSIAQYAAGGLFRWVAYGFKSAKSLLKTKAGKNKKKEIDGEDGVRWLHGLDMFSKVDELQSDLQKVFGGND